MEFSDFPGETDAELKLVADLGSESTMSEILGAWAEFLSSRLHNPEEEMIYLAHLQWSMLTKLQTFMGMFVNKNWSTMELVLIEVIRKTFAEHPLGEKIADPISDRLLNDHSKTHSQLLAAQQGWAAGVMARLSRSLNYFQGEFIVKDRSAFDHWRMNELTADVRAWFDSLLGVVESHHRDRVLMESSK